MKKSSRNKTIVLNGGEVEYYIGRCISVGGNVEKKDILDKIIFGNTFDVVGNLPKRFIDLVVIDPPYNLDKDFGGNRFKRVSREDYYRFTESWVELIKPLLKETASLYVCSDWGSSLVVGEVLHNNFHIQNRITWQREKGRGSKRNWKNSMEDIWFGTISKSGYTFNVDDVKMRKRVMAPYRVDGIPKDWEETGLGKFRDTYPSNFWNDITIPFWSMAENTEHPTQKPEKLLAKLVLASSNEGDVVLDPFMGSGTTAVVAKKLGRHYVGIESVREYCAVAQHRLEMADTDNRIQGYDDGIFWERNSLR